SPAATKAASASAPSADDRAAAPTARIPHRDASVGSQIAAELHAAVHLFRSLQFIFQNEVRRLAARPVNVGRSRRMLTRGVYVERAIFDAPHLGIALPVIQRLAVE